MDSEPGIGEFLIRDERGGDLLERYLDPDTQEEVLAGLWAELMSEAGDPPLGDDERILAALQAEYPGKRRRSRPGGQPSLPDLSVSELSTDPSG